MSDLFTNTISGAAAMLVLSCGVAFCCRLRRRVPEGTPHPPVDTIVQVQPTAPSMVYYPNAPQRYVVYMPQQNYYPQVQPPAFQPYPPTYTTTPGLRPY